MRGLFRGANYGVRSSFLVFALLAGCGGGDTDSGLGEAQNNNGGSSSTAGSSGSGQSAGSAGSAGKAGGSQGGSGAGQGGESGGSGQAGEAGAGQAGSGTAGDGGSGQAGDGGSGQAGDAGSGQAGDGGSGTAGDAGSGQAGDAGSGQAGQAGSGQAGDGGSAQAGTGQAGSGQGGSSGSAGQAGSGGSGQGGSGTGGSPGGCCKQDADCAGPDPVIQVCVGGQCKLPASNGQCWEDADCGVGSTCEGEFICPCGALCGPIADTEGKCVPVASGCCQTDDECKKQGLDQCVEGVCRAKLAAGLCWDSTDCSSGQVCQNAAPCPCNVDCDQDSPGKCVGASGNCCKQDADCGLNGACVNSICKATPPPGQCWEDADCGVGSTCQGGFVCPCGAACLLPDSLGKCTAGGNLCCKEDTDCAAQGLDKCAVDSCVKKAPSGQCWEDLDCKPGQTCEGEQVCPCGASCILPNTPGKCAATSPPGCCKQDADCGDKAQCILGGIGGALQGVCKPLLSNGTCWDDGDCKPGQTCAGEQVCPCGASCFVQDSPGKCQ